MRAVAHDEDARAALFRQQGQPLTEEQERAERYRQGRSGLRTATGAAWPPDLSAYQPDAS